jgi:hypothetical protein
MRKILVAIVSVVILVGCTGSGVSSPNSPSPRPPTATAVPTRPPSPAVDAVGTLTLTAHFDEMSARVRPFCGPEAEPFDGVDRVILTLVNTTNEGSRVDLLRIAAGHTYGQLQNHFAGQPKPPTWVGEVASVTLEAGESAVAEWPVHAGRYAIVCTLDEAQTQAQTGIAMVGPLEVE